MYWSLLGAKELNCPGISIIKLKLSSVAKLDAKPEEHFH